MAATVSGNAGKVELDMPYVLKEKESGNLIQEVMCVTPLVNDHSFLALWNILELSFLKEG